MAVAGPRRRWTPRRPLTPMSSVPVGPLPPQGAVAGTLGGYRAARFTPMAKRAIDIAIASLALIAAAPFFLIVSLMVRADGGPAFYAHPRVGRGGHGGADSQWSADDAAAECPRNGNRLDDADARADQYPELLCAVDGHPGAGDRRARQRDSDIHAGISVTGG